MAEKVLEVNQIKANIEEKEILHGVDLSVGAGEVHVLMGPNGTGKSTLGAALMGNPAYTVTGGDIIYKGQNINEMPDNERAKNGIFLELCGVALFCLFGLFLSKVYMHLFTDDANLQKLGEEYLFIVTVFCLGLFMSVVFERMLQATGNTTLSMATQLLGAIVNIILDPIMIFVLLG